MTRIWTKVIAAVVAAAALAIPAQAGYHVEVNAGQLLPTAEATTGASPFLGIQGSINPGNDVDLYEIYITGGAFSATTVGGASYDTQLFLFNSSGHGVMTNDDFNFLAGQSTISGVLAAGTYYIAVSAFDNDPTSALGLDFPERLLRPTWPDRAGWGSPLSGWTGQSFSGGGSYEIDITGAAFAVPVPAGAVMFGLGMASLGGARLFRRRKVAA